MINQLIDKRETPGNLDRAIQMLDDLKQQHPEKDIIRGKLAHAYYYKGIFAPPRSTEQQLYFAKGEDSGREAVTLAPDGIYGNFWYASNVGMHARCQGIVEALRAIEPIRGAMERVMRGNERFYFAGPHRVLGVLRLQAPGWPLSIGDKGAAAEHLERAIELAPDFAPNRLHLAQVYLGVGHKEAARQHLDWIIEVPLNPDHAIEDGAVRRKAIQLRARFF